MSILGAVTSGTSYNGQRIVIAGQEKIGKTTLCCDAPNALLIPLENGYASMTVRRTPQLEYWEHVVSLVNELVYNAQNAHILDPAFVANPETPDVVQQWVANPQHIPRGTSVVFDSTTALERIIHDNVLRTDAAYKEGNPGGLTMNSVHGGYGKGYHIAKEKFAWFLNQMDKLTLCGINVVLTCHVFAARVVDPAHGEYDCWDLLLHSPKNQKEYGKREMLTQWADLVGFYHEPLFVAKAEGSEIVKGVSQNKGRMLAVERTPSWVAGNRYRMKGMFQIPEVDGWNVLAHGIHEACGIDVFRR